MSTLEIATDTFEPTVAWLDDALGNDWSFRVVSSEVRDSEALVLGELAHAGRVRQQFGRSCGGRGNNGAADSRPPLIPIAECVPWETLRVATADALAQCANYFRRMPDRVLRPLPPERKHRTDGGKKTPLTKQQLSAIFSLAKFRGLDQAAGVSLTRERFTKPKFQPSLSLK